MVSVQALRSRGPEGLARLLRRRADVLDPQPPHSLEDLVRRLSHPASVRAALSRLDLPGVQVAQALAVFGRTPDDAQVRRLLGVDAGPARIRYQRTLAALDDLALLTSGGGLDGQARGVFGRPLGLGRPAAQSLSALTVQELHALAGFIGAARPARKQDALEAVLAAVTDAERVREMVATAPEAGQALLHRMARTGQVMHDVYYFSPRATNAVRPEHWAVQRGLLVRVPGQGVLEMPSEVALALRGPAWRAPFTPDPPYVPWAAADEQFVVRETTAAASRAAGLAVDLLDAASHRPIVRLKGGGVGVRELRRLAKTLRCTAGEARLLLDLAWRCGLLALTEAGGVPTPGFDTWVALQPGARHARLVSGWWCSPAMPMLDPEAPWWPEYAAYGWGDQIRVGELGLAVRAARAAVLFELARRPGRALADPEALAALLAWRGPATMLSAGSARQEEEPPPPDDENDDEDEDLLDDDPDGIAGPVADGDATVNRLARQVVGAVLAEAAFLGVVGGGSLSPAGGALVTGDAEALATGLGTLGRLQSTVKLQADLTAVVLGSPDPALTGLLDEVADREASGGAATWRFTPASVLRAFDAGLTAELLLADLGHAAPGGVPQPLQYLVRDVARRHGALRVAPTGCVLHSPDVALLAEVVADRSLAKLGLRQLAPTVLVCAGKPAELLAALRSAGYAPVEEGTDGIPVVVKARRHRAEEPRSRGRGAVQAAVLEDLLRRTDPAEPGQPGGAGPGDRDCGAGGRRPVAAGGAGAGGMVRRGAG